MVLEYSIAIGDIGGSILTARALAAKDEVAATRGFIYGGFIYLVLGMIPVIVGMCAFILYPDLPDTELDNVFPMFVQNHLPCFVQNYLPCFVQNYPLDQNLVFLLVSLQREKISNC